MSAAPIRVTVGLVRDTDAALDFLAEHTGLSKADIVNRAVQLYRFTEQSAIDGAHLALIQPDGSVDRLELL